MKKIFFLLLINSCCFGKSYYVNLSGNNTTGLTPSQGWTSISKINSSWKIIEPGDSILFKRGDTFYGCLKLEKSGNEQAPIIIGSYGTGEKPIISGFTTANGFKNIGGNIWESLTLENTNKPNMVTFTNVPTAMGRWPNSGYNFYDNFDATTFITDAALLGKNFTGGRLCIRKLHDIISNDSITSQVSNKINYFSGSGYSTIAGYGYFVENHLSTLDVQNEWFFDNTSKKIDIYSNTSPTNVKVSTIDTLIYIGQHDFITITDISFEGANQAAISFGGATVGQATNILIKYCSVKYSGRNAIYGTFNNNCTITNSTFNYSLNNALYFENEGGKSLNMRIQFDTIKNTGTLPGMGYINVRTSDNITHNAISVLGDNALIQYNQIDTVGHVGIAFYYDNCKIRNNYIDYHNFICDDGGGINVFDISMGKTKEVGREIVGNIVINGIGAKAGTADKSNVVVGIYIDDKADGIRIDSNSIANTARFGIFLHNATTITIRKNCIYNSEISAFAIQHDKHAAGIPVSNIIFAQNTAFQFSSASENNVLTPYFLMLSSTIDNGNLDSMFLKLDSNIYASMSKKNDSSFKILYFKNGTYTNANYTLKSWQSAYSNSPFAAAWDNNSVRINAISNKMTFKYNNTNFQKLINLGANYQLLDGKIIKSITLQPWTSIILNYVNP